MTLSTTRDFNTKPSTERKPVCISNTRKVANVKSKSVYNKACPILIEEYFFNIIATISVPPVEPPQLNKIAAPNAGKATANASSNTGSCVNGFSILCSCDAESAKKSWGYIVRMTFNTTC